MTARYGFAQLLRAEWTKFRTVRGWVIGMGAAALAIVLVGLLAASGTTSSCGGPNGAEACPTVPVGPGGEAVTDSFFFVRQPLDGNGSITVRVSSFTGRLPVFSPGGGVRAVGDAKAAARRGLEPWAKAGILIKESTTPGSPYAAIMVTGGHGVRMQDDYTHDTAGRPGKVSATSPRWLRLTRVGATITGYESSDGTHWTKVASAHLAAASSSLQAGLFVASPPDTQVSGGSASTAPTQATAAFDHVALRDARGPSAWTGTPIGVDSGVKSGRGRGSFRQAGDRFTVSGSGDIAPAASGAESVARTNIEQNLAGAFAGLIVVIILGTLFVTAEYRRGLIRTTLTASPQRGRVLVAKAIVIASVTFVAGLAAAAVVVPLGERILRANGNPVYPVSSVTELRVVAGTAALLAVVAVLAMSVGALLRRGAGAAAAVIVFVVLPYILAVSSALPASAAQWLLRVTPAAAFAIQQSAPEYHQVSNAYTPAFGYYPLSPGVGFAVLCAYTALALSLAIVLLRRRDA